MQPRTGSRAVEQDTPYRSGHKPNCIYCEFANTKQLANIGPCRVARMWALYRNTFVRFQVLIAVVSCAVFIAAGYRLPAAAVFFAVMQVGAVLGAMWGVPARR